MLGRLLPAVRGTGLHEDCISGCSHRTTSDSFAVLSSQVYIFLNQLLGSHLLPSSRGSLPPDSGGRRYVARGLERGELPL